LFVITINLFFFFFFSRPPPSSRVHDTHLILECTRVSLRIF
jgi:hypothetical protein